VLGITFICFSNEIVVSSPKTHIYDGTIVSGASSADLILIKSSELYNMVKNNLDVVLIIYMADEVER